MSFFAELQRRNVLRMAVAYIVAGWLLTQVFEIASNTFEAPAWVMKLIVTAIIVGIVPVLVFSWVYEMTPEGLKKETEIAPGASVTTDTAKKLDLAVIVLLVAAMGMFAADRFLGDRGEDATPTAQVEAGEENGGSEAPTASQASSIAVLPFADLSPGGDQGYFADGISEEILNLLARNGELRVIARTSAFKFRGEDHDLREVGEALNANRILEGSVRTAGTRVRITAQLIDSETNLHIWSDTYDRELTDIFALQDEIAGAITTALGVHLGVTGTALATESTPAAPEVDAYHLYLQGRKALAERDEPGRLVDAIDLLERAVLADPDLVAAHGALAIAHALSVTWIPAVTAQMALDATVAQAGRTLTLDPNNVDALVARGHVLGNLTLRIAAAEADFQRALEISPNHLTAVNLTGDLYQLIGDRERALYYDGLAVELDPLDSVMLADLALTYSVDMDWEASLRLARAAQALQPLSQVAAQQEIPALVHLGRFDEARERVQVHIDTGVTGSISPVALELWIAVAEGDAVEIERRYKVAMATAEEFGWDPVSLMWLTYWSGDLESCARYLQQAVDGGFNGWVFWQFSRSMPYEFAEAGIEFELPPRFAELMERRATSPWRHKLRRDALLGSAAAVDD